MSLVITTPLRLRADSSSMLSRKRKIRYIPTEAQQALFNQLIAERYHGQTHFTYLDFVQTLKHAASKSFTTLHTGRAPLFRSEATAFFAAQRGIAQQEHKWRHAKILDKLYRKHLKKDKEQFILNTFDEELDIRSK